MTPHISKAKLEFQTASDFQEPWHQLAHVHKATENNFGKLIGFLVS